MSEKDLELVLTPIVIKSTDSWKRYGGGILIVVVTYILSENLLLTIAAGLLWAGLIYLVKDQAVIFEKDGIFFRSHWRKLKQVRLSYPEINRVYIQQAVLRPYDYLFSFYFTRDGIEKEITTDVKYISDALGVVALLKVKKVPIEFEAFIKDSLDFNMDDPAESEAD